MEINSLKCNHCGGNLEIDNKVKFLNCGYCGSSLAVKRSGNAVFTEVLDEIKANTDELLSNSERLIKEQEIDRLDRDWLLEREKYKVKSNKGEGYFPEDSNSTSSMFGGIIFLVIFILFAAFFISNTNENRNTGSSFGKSTYTDSSGKKLSDDDLVRFGIKSRKSIKKDKTNYALPIIVFIILLGVIIFSMMSYGDNKDAYHSSKSKYLTKRQKLLDELEES